MAKSVAPWTAEQCEALNARQSWNDRHPYTCGGNRGDEAHRKHAEEHGDRDWGVLVATPEGWVCPVPGCGYKQGWAHVADTQPLPALS